MGIRVHKTIGYGLSDLKADKDGITDERINQNGWLMADYKTREARWNIDGLIYYMKSKDEILGELLNLQLADHKKMAMSLEQCFVHDPEYGLPNILLINPFNRRWTRYDDIIDYVEEISLQLDKSNKGEWCWYKTLKLPIWPTTQYMDSRSGSILKHGNDIARLIDKWDPAIYEWNDGLAKLSGFLTMEEAKKHLAPAIPEEIIAMAEYLKLFKDNATIWQMRPMIYVYWG